MSKSSIYLKLKKLYISFKLYGFTRTYIKAIGRLRYSFVPKLPLRLFPVKRTVAIIGCGQFSMSTIGFFLKKYHGNIIAGCFDIDPKQTTTFANYYGCLACHSLAELLCLPEIELVYIASNHATHTPYAIEAIRRGKRVYVEKPLSTSIGQFEMLGEVLKEHRNARIYIGYNRPFAPAVVWLRSFLKECHGPMTLNCFITGHAIPPDHWYRKPEEGSRVCGNLGHWIDMTINLLWAKKILPTSIQLTLICSSETEPDDNFTLSMVSNLGDLAIITLSSRDEPFEGINETINFQCQDVICKIDDFRRASIWKGDEFHQKRYFRKSIGHQYSVLQPFSGQTRNWSEVEISTKIMLAVTELLFTKDKRSTFYI